jgi:hypothetical protein
MRDSSTSSSEIAARTRQRLIQFRPRILSATFASIVAMLAATELVLRVPAVQRQLPIRTHFHEPGVVVRLETMEALKRQFHRIDVLFVGSSIIRCNVRPLLFDALLADRGHGEVVSFNAGMSGLWPAAVRLYLEQLWLPKAHPRLVVQGIRFGELFPSPSARKYDAIVGGPVESAWQYPGVLPGIRARAFERVHLLQYRGIWPLWLQRYRDGRNDAPDDDEVRVFTDPRGWTPRLPTLDIVLARHYLNGEKPNPALTDSAEWKTSVEEIRRSCRAARRAGAEYVLVNVPEHAFRWSGPDGRERYQVYLGVLKNLAEADRFPFVDVTDGDPARFALAAEFSDYHHMSPEGAAHFTRLLAGAFDSRVDVLPKLETRAVAVAISLP